MSKGKRKGWPLVNESNAIKSKDVFSDRERKLVQIMQEDEKDGLYDIIDF